MGRDSKQVARTLESKVYSARMNLDCHYGHPSKERSVDLIFFIMYEPDEVSLLCLMESRNRIQEWWSAYSL